MPRFLVATVPLTGHVQPLLPLVAELCARGHTVTWTAAAKFERSIAATGAQFSTMTNSWDDAELDTTFPELATKHGLARVKAQLRALFIEPMAQQLRDLEALGAPTTVISDSAYLGAGLYAEKHRVPWIGVGISALMAPSIDTAPFGSALRPRRLTNRFLNFLVFRLMFGSVNRAYRRAAARADVPVNHMYFEAMAKELFLQPTVPSFEYPRRDLPPQVKFIGPLVPPVPAKPLPAWWPEVAAARVPIVLVTQGTMATDPNELVVPALRALADRDCLVIATTPATLDLPANARSAAFVPYSDVLPHCAAMITNGGYGGVQLALAHGVPMIVAGGSEEKPEIAARVAWSGTGIDLRTRTPSPKAIDRAVARILDEPHYRERARAIQREMESYAAPKLAADLIEATIR